MECTFQTLPSAVILPATISTDCQRYLGIFYRQRDTPPPSKVGLPSRGLAGILLNVQHFMISYPVLHRTIYPIIFLGVTFRASGHISPGHRRVINSTHENYLDSHRPCLSRRKISGLSREGVMVPLRR